jgi:hypothetical protein
LERQAVKPTIIDDSSQHPVQILQSPHTLSLVFQVMQYCIQRNQDSENACYASLHLFYATYSPVPNDKITQEGMLYLIEQLSFPTIALEILCKIDSVALALSLIRNLHNMVVSLQGAAKIILNARVDPSLDKVTAPWIAHQTRSPPSSATMCLISICTSMAFWCVALSTPEFPGYNTEDKRSELVVEILNCFYALQIGKQLNAASVENGNNPPDLVKVVLTILQLSPPSNHAAAKDDVVCTHFKQCKLAVVSLLMDSDASFGHIILEKQSLHYLLQILTLQVNDVVDNTRVDGSATAALVPILAVLNKYALRNLEVKNQIKKCVFPPDTEEQFQKKIQELQTSKSNMGPLDAPNDTLRGRLVILLSWAESHIKRFAAELLWTLCNSDATQYVHRVGMGNALPLLNAKGLASIPFKS